MRIFILFLLFTTCSLTMTAQVKENDFNLDFEDLSTGSTILHWKKKNNQVQWQLDSIIKYSGQYSLSLETDGASGMVNEISGIVNEIRETYKGKHISLEAFIKTEDVSNAYFYMIVGTDSDQIYFDMTTPVSGTSNWKKMMIQLPYTSEATKITIACNIEGKGKIWLDEINVKIDEKNIKNIDPVKNVISAASNFSVENLTDRERKKIYIIGKLWGFLKYYHPKVATGAYNWDQELFKILPFIKEEDFSLKITNWVKSLGPIEQQQNSINFKEAFQAPHFEWFKNSLINKELKVILEELVKSERPENNFYVKLEKNVKTPVFMNEKPYNTLNYNDDGLKLLALFRYWNMIEYFYPYKYLIPHNWDMTLENFISKIIHTEDEISYTLCLAELISRTQDTHHQIYGNKALAEFYGSRKIPVRTIFIKDQLVVEKSFDEENLLIPGDVVLEMDNKPIAVLKKEYLNYNVASNYSTTLREIAKKVLRTNKAEASIKIKRGDKVLEFRLSTIPFYKKQYYDSEPAIKEISGDIGYLNTKSLDIEDYDSILNKWQNKKAIIIDLRVYPKENFTRLLPLLIEEPVIFYRSTSGSIKYPGVFWFDDKIFIEPEQNSKFKGKLFVLINEDTQSKAEFNALALKSYKNSILIGNQTAGTDGDVSEIILPGNIKTLITGIGIYGADKSQTQKTGIIPDIVINKTVQDVVNSKDPILERAIQEASQL